MAPDRARRPEASSFWDLALLSRTRELVRRPVYRIVAASIAIAYALGSMLIGGMLIVNSPPIAIRSFWTVVPSGYPWWDYPGLLVVTPGFVLALPFLPTISMVVVSVGVGVGMTVAAALTVTLLRRRKSELGRPAAMSSVAGLTPAMIALVTLGACCSTTAAATAGVGLAAQASGTTINALLLNNWYLGLFQVGVLYAALLAQEQLLAVYGYLFRPTSAKTAPAEVPRARPVDRRFVLSGTLRVALIAGGVTWSLAMFAEWTVTSPFDASVGTWFSWIAQHQFLALTAVLAALVPLALVRYVQPPGRPSVRAVARGAWIVVGISLAGWTPPAIASSGVYGFVNELLGLWGLPASVGAVAPSEGWGLALLLRWVFQYILLGGFALWLGISGPRTLAWLLDPTETTPPVSKRRVPSPSGNGRLREDSPPIPFDLESPPRVGVTSRLPAPTFKSSMDVGPGASGEADW